MWTRCSRWLKTFDLDARRYRFDAEPTRATHADYDQARSAWLDRARSCGALVAVYEIGTVSVPGISDIDFLVVVRDDCDRDACTGLSIRGLGARDQDLFLHDPYVIGEQHVTGFLRFFSPRALVRRAGSDVIPCIPPATPMDALPRLGEDYLHYLRYFARLLITRRIDLRWCLPVLSSVKYSVPIETALTGHTPMPHEADVLAHADAIKRDWFTPSDPADRRQQLVTLCARVCGVVLASVERLAHTLGKMGVRPVESAGPRERSMVIPGGMLRFVPGWSPERFLDVHRRDALTLGPVGTYVLRRLGRFGAQACWFTTALPVEFLVFLNGGTATGLGATCREFVAWRRDVLRFLDACGLSASRPIRSLADDAHHWWRRVGLVESIATRLWTASRRSRASSPRATTSAT